MWLNNCIGGKNYRQFLVFITSANIAMLFLITLEFISIFKTNQDVHYIRYVLLVSLLAVDIIFFLCLSYLILFHVYINYLGLTTLEY